MKMNVTVNENWPESLPEAVELEKLMKCPICLDYINTAMLIPECSHNFCSLCIRKYFQFKTQCPICGMPASDPDLRNNRILDSIVKQFLVFRKNVLDKKNIGQMTSDEVWNNVPSKYTVTKSCVLSTKTSLHEKFNRENMVQKKVSEKCLTIDSEDGIQNRDTSVECSDGNTNGESTTTHPFRLNDDVSKEQTSLSNSQDCSLSDKCSKKEKKKSSASDSASVKVACPVCGVPMQERYVNLHLDRCLRNDISEEITKRKPLTKIVYNLMSDKDIKKKLKELGLSIQGDRQTLIKRHREFLMFYNADGDSLNPKPLSVLVKKFEKMENLKSTMSKRSNHSNIIVKKGSKPEEIRKAQKHYAKKNNTEYSKLIADVKKRMAETKHKSVKTSSEVDSDICENETDTISEDLYSPNRNNLEAGGQKESCVNSENNSNCSASLTEGCLNQPKRENDLDSEDSVQISNKIPEADQNFSPTLITKIKVEQKSFEESSNRPSEDRSENKLDSLSESEYSDDDTKLVSPIFKSRKIKIERPSFTNTSLVRTRSWTVCSAEQVNDSTGSVNLPSSEHFQTTEKKSSRRLLISPNFPRISSNIFTRSELNIPDLHEMRVENSDPEDTNETNFMDALSDCTDTFGSDSPLKRSSICKEMWPALSQTSDSQPSDSNNKSEQRMEESSSAICQNQDNAVSSAESDVLDFKSEDLQVTDISTCQSKAKKRIPLRRSARCIKKPKESATAENCTPRKKKHKSTDKKERC